MTRLNQLVAAVTEGLEAYELDVAARPIEDFIDDLSTWYLRRSRDRFKSDDEADKQAALATTSAVLGGLSEAIAPFMPFLAEEVYKRAGSSLESVHLEDWPVGGDVDLKLISDMKMARLVASKGLDARMAVKINVRQPLKSLASGIAIGSPDLVELIKDEVNVKEVVSDPSIGKEVRLDTAITPELKEEGDLRELLRKIQDLRKEKGLSIKDKAVFVATDDLKGLISKHEEDIKKATALKAIEYGGELAIKI